MSDFNMFISILCRFYYHTNSYSAEDVEHIEIATDIHIATSRWEVENSSNNPNEDVDEADAAAYSEADIPLDTAIVGDEHETEMSLRLFLILIFISSP